MSVEELGVDTRPILGALASSTGRLPSDRSTTTAAVARARVASNAFHEMANSRQPIHALLRVLVGASRPRVLCGASTSARAVWRVWSMNRHGGRAPATSTITSCRKIVETTPQTRRPDAGHWTARTLARHLKLNHMTVARVWDRHGLQPHRVRTLKLSRDKQSVEKLTHVVGLYLTRLTKPWIQDPLGKHGVPLVI